MTTSATAFTTRLRTWLLVAGLTALVIALGALIGGAFLWLCAGLAVIFNVAGYFYSDRIALRVARAEPLSEQLVPEIHAVVRHLADRAGVSSSPRSRPSSPASYRPSPTFSTSRSCSEATRRTTRSGSSGRLR